jgi:hypothetical protein
MRVPDYLTLNGKVLEINQRKICLKGKNLLNWPRKSVTLFKVW